MAAGLDVRRPVTSAIVCRHSPYRDIGVGGRLYRWLYKDEIVSGAVNVDDIVVVMSLDEFPYIASALETYLIGEVSPTLNKVLAKR